MTGDGPKKARAGLTQEWANRASARPFPACLRAQVTMPGNQSLVPITMANLLRRESLAQAINAALGMYSEKEVFSSWGSFCRQTSDSSENRKYCEDPTSPLCGPHVLLLEAYSPASLWAYTRQTQGASPATVIQGQGPANCHPRALSRQLPAC